MDAFNQSPPGGGAIDTVMSLAGRLSVAGISTIIFLPLEKASLFASIASIIASPAPKPLNISLANSLLCAFITLVFFFRSKLCISRLSAKIYSSENRT